MVDLANNLLIVKHGACNSYIKQQNTSLSITDESLANELHYRRVLSCCLCAVCAVSVCGAALITWKEADSWYSRLQHHDTCTTFTEPMLRSRCSETSGKTLPSGIWGSATS